MKIRSIGLLDQRADPRSTYRHHVYHSEMMSVGDGEYTSVPQTVHFGPHESARPAYANQTLTRALCGGFSEQPRPSVSGLATTRELVLW